LLNNGEDTEGNGLAAKALASIDDFALIAGALGFDGHTGACLRTGPHGVALEAVSDVSNTKPELDLFGRGSVELLGASIIESKTGWCPNASNGGGMKTSTSNRVRCEGKMIRNWSADGIAEGSDQEKSAEICLRIKSHTPVCDCE
jgi:hypothetical protein